MITPSAVIETEFGDVTVKIDREAHDTYVQIDQSESNAEIRLSLLEARELVEDLLVMLDGEDNLD